MKICISGTPGVGKTSIAKLLGTTLGLEVINERELAVQNAIAEFDPELNELVVPLNKLEKSVNKLLSRKKNVIIEGHMLCEIKGRFDVVFVLRLHPEKLAYRLEARGYKDEKVQDNVFCEGIDYCLKHALHNYSKNKVVEIANAKTIKDATALIIAELLARFATKGGKKAKKVNTRKK